MVITIVLTLITKVVECYYNCGDLLLCISITKVVFYYKSGCRLQAYRYSTVTLVHGGSMEVGSSMEEV